MGLLFFSQDKPRSANGAQLHSGLDLLAVLNWINACFL